MIRTPLQPPKRAEAEPKKQGSLQTKAKVVALIAFITSLGLVTLYGLHVTEVVDIAWLVNFLGLEATTLSLQEMLAAPEIQNLIAFVVGLNWAQNWYWYLGAIVLIILSPFLLIKYTVHKVKGFFIGILLVAIIALVVYVLIMANVIPVTLPSLVGI